MRKIRWVCATRAPHDKFFGETALGRSLSLYGFLSGRMELQLFPGNTLGLPVVYNMAIERAAQDPAILVFAHDDLYLCDFFWFDKLQAALQSFDVVGLAGNRRRLAKQPAWCFIDDRGTWDQPENLSGVVGAGQGFPCARVVAYGPVPQRCQLLDGLLLAADSATLVNNQIRFDPRFPFHFYDMDLCRQVDAKGLKMGTWPISAVHESGGAFGSASWRTGLRDYLEKYGE